MNIANAVYSNSQHYKENLAFEIPNRNFTFTQEGLSFDSSS